MVKFATKLSLGLRFLFYLSLGYRFVFLTCTFELQNLIFLFLRTDNVGGSNSYDSMQKKFVLKFLDTSEV